MRSFFLSVGLSIFLAGCLAGENKQFFEANNTSISLQSPTPVQKATYTSQLTVGAVGTTPPLDLFFIVDNSASMLGHQINLGQAFSNIFTANSAALSKFDANVYVFSTASTVHSSYLGQVPTLAPASVTSIPALTDITNLAQTPGSIFGLWNQASGQYGVAPFSVQYNPAPVLNAAGGQVYSSLFLGKKGALTDAAYQAKIDALTAQFQSKLSYLNPTNQLSQESLTDVSSGLCSMARILKHPSGLIKSGDSAAFILVSDDNDRLNERNTNNNQCIDSVVGSNQVVDGTCGHYQTNFTYNSTSTLTYQTDTKFNYQSGTQLNYTYPASETCAISYRNGYNYTSTYTAVKTQITYTKCSLIADGTCLSVAPGTVQVVDGNYAGASGACTQDMSSIAVNPAPGTNYVCVSKNLTGQVGTAGLDAASNGSACSAATLAALNAQANHVAVTCSISGANTASASFASQALGSCANYCSTHSQYAACALTSTTPKSASGSLSLPQDGLTCTSTCPDSTKCGGGTISAYFATLHANTTCGSPTPLLHPVVVSAGASSDAKAISCTTPLSGMTVKNASNQVVCAGQSTMQACIASLQTSAATNVCATAGGTTATVTGPVGVTCTTTCANSSGFCPSTYANVSSYLAQSKQALCKSAANGGAKSFALVFNAATAKTASCSSLCSATASGSCDGAGWGVANGSTVANYVSSLGGASCASSTVQVSDTTSMAVASANTAAACTNAASPFFFATSSAHPASSVTNYVAGDVNHKATDFQNYIVSQSKAVLGANNPAAVAVIGHLATDNLYGTSTSTDYINLAKAMNSDQVSSISGNYSTALGSISDFIVETTQNSFALTIPSTDTVFEVWVMHQGSTTWTQVNSSLWTWAGSTLSVSQTAALKTGDQLMYKYHEN